MTLGIFVKWELFLDKGMRVNIYVQGIWHPWPLGPGSMRRAGLCGGLPAERQQEVCDIELRYIPWRTSQLFSKDLLSINQQYIGSQYEPNNDPPLQEIYCRHCSYVCMHFKLPLRFSWCRNKHILPALPTTQFHRTCSSSRNRNFLRWGNFAKRCTSFGKRFSSSFFFQSQDCAGNICVLARVCSPLQIFISSGPW